MTDHRIKKIALVSGIMAADAFQWTDRDMANAQIAAANASKQKMYETGEPVYVGTFGLDDEISREDFVASAAFPSMAEASYDYYGRTGAKGPEVVPNFSNMHIADQGMQSLFSLAEAYADKITQPTLTIYSSTAFTALCSTHFFGEVDQRAQGDGFR